MLLKSAIFILLLAGSNSFAKSTNPAFDIRYPQGCYALYTHLPRTIDENTTQMPAFDTKAEVCINESQVTPESTDAPGYASGSFVITVKSKLSGHVYATYNLKARSTESDMGVAVTAFGRSVEELRSGLEGKGHLLAPSVEFRLQESSKPGHTQGIVHILNQEFSVKN